MGTLTASCPRLDAHCPHKLATSCRLTSTPNCCACADERPHSRLYRVYVDGVGYVQRGTRWQSYCWFCKEFWNNRLAATDPPLEASQTQVPHIPDQSEFLERWFEFHQGYRIVAQPDGSDSRIAVVGEPFSEVSPGFLPRTLDQLRANRQNDASRPDNVFRRRRLTSEEERPAEAQQSIEDALDDLLEGLSDEEEAPGPIETERLNTDMPRRNSSGGLSRPLTRTEVNLQRARDRLVRVFGSREDVQREDYESPLSTMYNRAEERYEQAEGRRATGETTDPRTNDLQNLPQQERGELEEQILWGVLQDSQRSFLERNQGPYHAAELDSRNFVEPDVTPSSSNTTSASTSASSLRSSLNQITSDLSRLQAATDAVANARIALARQRPPHPLFTEPKQTLDQPDRPPPLTDAQMTKKLDCQVCYSQIADIALLPCGHMVMCQWCADVVVPVRHGHIPARPSKCPMCRKMVKQRFKIHTGGDDVVMKQGRTGVDAAGGADAGAEEREEVVVDAI
ncbi:hypothetical protein P171DRAFT_428351 [Karstenula rhodostoma CBS 690.94]|uniref:RING-type domain-containing protein n=1 Tax=Karstenula rhodostoma CBS 690.94 TaxID=1392251 RepID=A0A9P4PQ93_9PLEO|nr:hypothetical protein P171DRAFT_428351 [Karstenula rhodostoma CBS 690.94]